MELMMTRWGQVKLWRGDADATIWGGLNGVGSEAIEERSERGNWERLRDSEEGFGRTHTVDTATCGRASFLASHHDLRFPFCSSQTHPHGDERAF